VTFGHIDLVRRALKLFSHLIIGVANPLQKRPLFDRDERIRFIEEEIRDFGDRVEVELLDGLTVDFARKRGACALLRGLRVVSDFENEFKMAWMNRRLNEEIETVFLFPSERYAYVASNLVKEIAALGGDVRNMVPERVADRLLELRRAGKLGNVDVR
jgi:pantetheine-phosphate adenylyltransferase